MLGGSEGFQVILASYDAQGEQQIRKDVQVSCDPDAIDPSDLAKAKPKAVDGTPVAYSEDSKKLKGLFDSLGSSTSISTLPRELLAKIMRPDVKDPLAYMETDRLLAVAEHDGCQLIADLPDDSFPDDEPASSGDKATVEQIEDSLHSGKMFDASMNGDCLVIRPSHPARSRTQRLDRRSLATLIAETAANGQASLADLADYASVNEYPDQSAIASTYAFFLAPLLTLSTTIRAAFPGTIRRSPNGTCCASTDP